MHARAARTKHVAASCTQGWGEAWAGSLFVAPPRCLLRLEISKGSRGKQTGPELREEPFFEARAVTAIPASPSEAFLSLQGDGWRDTRPQGRCQWR